MTDKKDKITEEKVKTAEVNAEQACQDDSCPSSDIYAEVEKDPETGVDVPTEKSVEEAKEWVDQENRR